MHWVGILLKPVLLLALKCEPITVFTSLTEIFAAATSSGRVNSSCGRAGLQYNLSLNVANWVVEMPTVFALFFNIPQKRLGSYFNIFGAAFANSCFLFRHVL
jgi:hypothetical protein